MDESIKLARPRDQITGSYADTAVTFATCLLESANDLVAAVNTDLRFVALNAAFRREFEMVFGRPVELGQRLDSALAHVTGDRATAIALCRRALAGESFRVIEELGDAQLLRKSYELAFSPVFDTHHQVLMAAIVMRDLTTLRLSERRFGALLEAAPDAMIIIRADGVIDLANSHAETMFRYGHHQLTGMAVETLLPERFRASHSALRSQFSRRPVARPMGRDRGELSGLRADGTEFPVDISLSPLDVGGEQMVVGAIRDMTNRQRSVDRVRALSAQLEQRADERRRELEQASEMFRATFDRAPVGIAHMTIDGRWLRVNPALCNIVGYQAEELLTGMSIRDITHPDDLGRELTLMQQLARGEIPAFSFEKRYHRKNGDLAWVEITRSLVQDASGAPAYCISVVTDIDARKRAELELEQGRARLAAIFDNLNEGVIVADAQGNVLDMNQAALALHGYSDVLQARRHLPEYADTFELHRLDGSLLPISDWPLARVLRDERFAGVDVEVRNRANGVNRIVSYSGVPVFDGGGQPVLAVLVVRDITAEKRAEKALQESEARFNAFMDATPAQAWIVDDEGRIRYVNKSWEASFGLERKDWIGKTAFDLWAPEVAAKLQENDRAARESGKAIDSIEVTVGSAMDDVRYWRAIKFPFNSGDGQRLVGGMSLEITEQIRTQEALRESEAALKATFDQAAVGIVHMALPECRFLRVNNSFCKILGYLPEELTGLTAEDMIDAKDCSLTVEDEARLRSGQVTSFTTEKRAWRKDGAIVWLRITLSPVRDAQDVVLYAVALVEDITHTKQLDMARRESEKRLRLAVSIAHLGFWEWDVAANDVYFSPQWKAQLGYEEHELRNSFEEWSLRLHPDDRSRVLDDLAGFIARPETDFRLEYRLRHRDDNYRWMAARAIALSGMDGRAEKLIGIQQDVTESKLAEQRILEAAQHDPLTGLPSRALVFEYAGHLLAAARRNHTRGAFLFIDLDRFKPVNDLYGHETGDRLLKEVAKRLLGCVRDEDLVGRLGGDEFIIVLPHLGGNRGEAIAAHVLESMAQPFHIGTLELSISVSIGVSYFPQHGTDVDALIHAADLAMYQTKQSGRASFHLYTDELDAHTDAAAGIEARLKRALRENGLTLHYQPVIDMHSGILLGAEALLRLTDQDDNVVGPERFIPIAESAGLIGALGEWVSVEAFRQHEEWRRQGLPPVTIAINVSPLQFRQRGFADMLRRIVRNAGIDPGCVQIEVTESTVMDNIDDAIATLNAIKSMGMKIALDDFGTGYSSLSHLSHLPLDKLKVDQSFVQSIEHDRTSQAITGAIISLGRTLDLQVGCEGVETESALHYLQEQGCDQAQGFFISRPLPAAEFGRWMRAHC